jgi:4-alpha-glucanotransferase
MQAPCAGPLKINMQTALKKRASGVLLHISSLPGPGIQGDFGQEAYLFIDFLCASGFSYWQILPTGPTDNSFSPYQSSSAFAGNSLFISLKKVADMGLLTADQNAATSRATHHQCLKQAYANFRHAQYDVWHAEFQLFCQQEQHWLKAYATFSAFKQYFDGAPWYEWPEALRTRDPAALDALSVQIKTEIDFFCFEQWLYDRQWMELNTYARSQGVELIGDMAIFVAHDSADVWQHPALFQLNKHGQLLAVAGVPPDYFSADGQRWGNPLYAWERMLADDFHWWVQRINHLLRHVSLIRIDHFRGFEACWEIPAQESTAIHGHWHKSPGKKLFKRLAKDHACLPIIAEDLGLITPEVITLRDAFKLPGMKVLQFAFDSDNHNPYLPHNHVQNCVVYTGTHDNNTSLGWYNALSPHEKERVNDYLGHPKDTMPWPLIHCALASVAQLAIVPFQDLLSLDATHRMNTPGTCEGNWHWRFDWEQLASNLSTRCRQLNNLYGRH